ncbi:MAG: hypothetical protein AUH15_04670 [Acidobacteriales bacterium 13_2_20CM_55_8]|nr:MAG: hypothetical protein AUH15_04670 [Acidobacteriales bacterium 13_2_20CM_55_8]
MTTSPYRVLCWLLFLLTLTIPIFAAGPAPHITIALDATEAPRKIFHARMTIPTTGGPLTLYYPKWIPGEHGPTGPIQDLAGLKFTANGQILKWRRDLLDGWTIHVDVPAGAASADASLDFISPAGAEGLYTGGRSATDKMSVISWNTMLLYPAGWTSDELTYEATLRLPAGWKYPGGFARDHRPIYASSAAGTESASRDGYCRRQCRRSGRASGSRRSL